MTRTRIVCCISSVNEAETAVKHGADALGLVGEMPSGPGVIDDDLVGAIADQVPPGVDTFLLTSRVAGEEIADQVEYCRTTAVQIVRHIEPSQYEPIIRRLPTIRRIQVIHVEDDSALELIDAYERYVHAFLLDSGRPNAAVVELGGTGRSHDWQVSAQIVRKTRKPVFLAGGLNPKNVGQAVSVVRPYGVDLCSGLRTGDHLDPVLLGEFMQQVRRADAARWPGGKEAALSGHLCR